MCVIYCMGDRYTRVRVRVRTSKDKFEMRERVSVIASVYVNLRIS